MVDDCYTDAKIADFFSHKYQDLYTSVPFNVNDMEQIWSRLSASIQIVSGKCSFSCNEVLKAVDKLKLHKAEGGKGLSSDYFKKAGRDLYVTFLLSGILMHSYIADDLSVSTIFLFLKGRTHMSLTLLIIEV